LILDAVQEERMKKSFTVEVYVDVEIPDDKIEKAVKDYRECISENADIEDVMAQVAWNEARYGGFCKVRGISESGLFQAIQKGKVPSKKCGKFRYVLPADYEAYVLSSREHRIASITKARGSARTKLAKMKEAPDA